MTHFKKHWWKYLLLALAVIYVITSLVKNEWNPMKWFASGNGSRQINCGTAQSNPNYESCCRHNPEGRGCIGGYI